MNYHDSLRFYVDGSLGKLTVFLRLMGYDTVLCSQALDSMIAEFIDNSSVTVRVLTSSQKVKQRILIRLRKQIKDKNASLHDLQVWLIPSNVVEALKTLHEHGIQIFVPQNITTSRCSKCNGKLSRLDTITAKTKVPPGSYERFQEFFECEACHQVYWIGSHWRRIRETIRKALEDKRFPTNDAKV